MSGPIHLARRFLGSLSPRPLDPRDDAWVGEVLLPGERTLWEQMPLADRKHAAGVAREVDEQVHDADRAVLAAALLHDVGKIESGLGTLARVAATVMVGVLGRERVAAWDGGIAGRFSSYVRHPAIGADLLDQCGADQLTVQWAADHHLPADRWRVPPRIGAALHDADDD